MREIKFRAWEENGKNMISPEETGDHTLNDLTEVMPYILMQFTGLKDKNGSEIYEGDVMLLPDSEIVPITDEGQGPIEEMNHLCPVEFKEGCFGLSVLENSGVFHKGFWSFDSIFNGEGYKLEDLEIIGNIYENPELLK